jgi:multisubunit Na+/H+ antiporter MnhB subunit
MRDNCSEPDVGFPGVATETRTVIFILALVSPLLVPWSNRGASNLGESG